MSPAPMLTVSRSKEGSGFSPAYPTARRSRCGAWSPTPLGHAQRLEDRAAHEVGVLLAGDLFDDVRHLHVCRTAIRPPAPWRELERKLLKDAEQCVPGDRLIQAQPGKSRQCPMPDVCDSRWCTVMRRHASGHSGSQRLSGSCTESAPRSWSNRIAAAANC